MLLPLHHATSQEIKQVFIIFDSLYVSEEIGFPSLVILKLKLLLKWPRLTAIDEV